MTVSPPPGAPRWHSNSVAASVLGTLTVDAARRQTRNLLTPLCWKILELLGVALNNGPALHVFVQVKSSRCCQYCSPGQFSCATAPRCLSAIARGAAAGPGSVRIPACRDPRTACQPIRLSSFRVYLRQNGQAYYFSLRGLREPSGRRQGCLRIPARRLSTVPPRAQLFTLPGSQCGQRGTAQGIPHHR